ncbi:nucleotidyltransferase domain-containing protein [Mastigocoleus sp. MO_188.B34]|uniref:nucleotidyltransferase domain-containing protein n=1 Tax=Mastigocoleus sp. MO_188.B34 TaxID=3036635 RepID=UPI0026236BE0|nr:nucleotidyltransferase domain-containing protein [Mastigocoleus sp. MO_188.B34]MDJ0693803.1 nucleotidyltransferase domain-containing protein [Mastigocoleus sp. MO_188.B34]
MNEANEIRLTLARQNAASYITIPQVRAIGIAGSVARGEADAYSDIDMSIYYEELPKEKELKLAYKQNQGTDYRVYDDEHEDGALVEQYFVQGIKCDFGHVTIERFEGDIKKLLEECHPENIMLKVLEGIVDMVPLHGAELIEQWKAKVANYPDRLAQAMVKKHMQFRPLWVLNNYAIKRGDVLFLANELQQAVKKIIGVLLGLNRFYHPVNSAPFKGIDKLINKMTIAPPNLSFRLKQILQEEPKTAVNQLDELIEETFTLVEKHMPQVDTTEAMNKYQLWSNKFQS